MKPEKISPKESFGEPEVPQQLDLDFSDEEAVQARTKELRNEHGWTEPYARSVANIEFATKKREERSGQKKKSN